MTMPGFPQPSNRPARILGLFAHPDDEVFCMGGTIAKLTDAGAVGRIVSLTRGEAGQIRDVTAASRRTLGEVRERELAAAAAALGVADTRCLDLADGTLAAQPIDDLVETAVDIIDEFEPDTVISFGPDGGYGHPDHMTVSTIATAAAQHSRSRPITLHAAFPRSRQLLLSLIVEWLEDLDDRFRGSEEFATGLMLFANGSSMLGYAADHLDVRFYPAGTYIIEQGEPPGELFLVLSGNVDIVAEATDGSLTTLASAGPGSFVGEDGIARGQPRNAHVVAVDGVTCFVLSPGAVSLSAGRGSTSEVETFLVDQPGDTPGSDWIEVDVRAQATQKARALACHRSQYALRGDMFPRSMVEGLFGVEYFVQARGEGRGKPVSPDEPSTGA